MIQEVEQENDVFIEVDAVVTPFSSDGITLDLDGGVCVEVGGSFFNMSVLSALKIGTALIARAREAHADTQNEFDAGLDI